MFIFFFFKQKTAYEMRISDRSSDVCSSDLLAPYGIFVGCKRQIRYRPADDRDGRPAKQGFGRRIPIMDLPSRTENNDAVGGNIRETRFLGGHRIYRLYDRHGLKSECGSCVWIAEASAARSRSSGKIGSASGRERGGPD